MLGKIVPAVALACALTPANAELLTHKDLPLAGASGSPGVDEPCVQAGLDKVADQLK